MSIKNTINYIFCLILLANTSGHSIETRLNIREIIKNHEFLCDEFEIVAQKKKVDANYYDEVIHYYYDYEDNENNFCLISYNKENVQNVYEPATKYDKAHFLKVMQESLNIINLKLNNKLQLNEHENNILNNLETNKNILLAVKKEENSHHLYNSSITEDILGRFNNDIIEIKSRNSVRNQEEQLKIDIYNQKQDMNKFATEHDESFKLMHNYFLNAFYSKNCVINIFKKLFNSINKYNIKETHNESNDLKEKLNN